MADKIYAKFVENVRGPSKFYMSSELDAVKKWTGKSPRKKSAKAATGKKTEVSEFRQINEKIFNDFIAFYDLTQLVSDVAMVYPETIIKSEIKNKFKNNGKKVASTTDDIIYSLDSSELNSIDKTVRKVRSISSVSHLFKRFHILGLVSHYDYFIQQIIRALISRRPDIVVNKDATIAYADIFEFKDMEEVKHYLIDKEVENVMRQSHEDQISWFSKKLDMKMEPHQELMSEFVELCERRNLLAHSGGRVSSSYINKCKRYGCDIKDAKIGTQLQVDNKYIENAVDTLIEMSFQILHVIWEKIEPDSSKEVSSAMINITFSLIQEEKYKIAIRLIEFLLNNKSTKMDEVTRKTHIINCANAKKLSGSEDYEILIKKEDWSACTQNFILCKYAILEDVNSFLDIMESCVKSGAIEISDLREWPVFKPMRQIEKVRKAFSDVFKEPLVLESTVDTK